MVTQTKLQSIVALRVFEGVPYICRRPGDGDGASWKDATISVTFPPQHLAEEIVDGQEPSACNVRSSGWPVCLRLS